MRNQVILLSLLSSLIATGCKALECADGTVERDGRCEAPDNVATSASCGPFTVLVGERCVPEFPPTVCEDGTTAAEVDPATGVTTCRGIGGGGCDTSITCLAPTSSSRMTICGQLYDFETNLPFKETDAKGVECDPTAPTADGPCSLGIQAYDALAFGEDPSAAMPLPITEMVIDNCGRFRVAGIDLNGTGPFIGLGVDDIAPSGAGPTGVTVTAAVATPKSPMGATKGVEAWIVKPATANAWATSGGPTLQTGVYAPIFRAHKAGTAQDQFANQMGVTATLSGNPIPSTNAFYFPMASTTRGAIDPGATATGANGTVLINNADVDNSVNYGGQGGLGTGCRWEPHAGASLPGIVFIQVFRKLDIVGQTRAD